MIANATMSTKVLTASASLVPNTISICDSSDRLELTLPTTCKSGDIFTIIGKGSGGWTLSLASTQAFVPEMSFSSASYNDQLRILCITDGTTFKALGPQSNEYTLPAAKGLLLGGQNSAVTNIIQINTAGNASAFGKASGTLRIGMTSYASSVYAYSSGYDTTSNVVESTSFATSSVICNFGQVTYMYQPYYGAGCSFPLFGLISGGCSTPTSLGRVMYHSTNAIRALYYTVLPDSRYKHCSLSSNTRAVFAGGTYSSSEPNDNTITYMTAATMGQAVDYGDLPTVYNILCTGTGNSVRGLIAGGADKTAANAQSSIRYITISTTGNTTAFGSLSIVLNALASCASPTRAVFALGGNNNTLEYVSIATTGNTADFGDLTYVYYSPCNKFCSNTPGGLQ